MKQPLKSSVPQKLEILGTWGQFGGSEGSPRVFYLQTVLSPGNAGTPESELSSLTVPVREVFDMERLTFEQLLQRDLDDHRVASELIPYLLERPNIPKFFPPILAVIVPFEKNEVGNDYGTQLITPAKFPDGTDWDYETHSFSDLFDFKRPVEKNTRQYSRSSAELHLNRHKVKLMVVDGQHRAMAILAIQRNLLNGWEQTRGESFKHFYSDIDLGRIPTELLNKIELPVCICFFPDVTNNSSELSLPKICRKIFLDVNREARAPSESRNILMDDYDLRAVFTRSIFSQTKNTVNTTAGLKLRHVEYDNPRDSQQVEKSIALTNVRSIENIIEWLLVRPDSFYNDISYSYQKGKFKINNSRLQRILDLSSHISNDNLQSWGIGSIADLRVDDFPAQAREKLGLIFQKNWGNIIFFFFSEFAPYKNHIEAVDAVYKKTEDAGDEYRLARQGLFEGQGLYHTLKSSAERRAEYRKYAIESNVPFSAAEKAWTQVQKWVIDFKHERSLIIYKHSKTILKEDSGSVDRAFDTLRTQAFQIGALMAIAYLIENLNPIDINAAANNYINIASNGWSKDIKKRLLMFDRKSGNGLSSVYPNSLSPTDWPFFRYCFFELMLAGISDDSQDLNFFELLQAAVDTSRMQLLERLTREELKRAKKEGKSYTEKSARKAALNTLQNALKVSLGLKHQIINDSLARASEKNGNIESLSAVENEEDSDIQDSDNTDEV